VIVSCLPRNAGADPLRSFETTNLDMIAANNLLDPTAPTRPVVDQHTLPFAKGTHRRLALKDLRRSCAQEGGQK
jgi:hypothetical protein